VSPLLRPERSAIYVGDHRFLKITLTDPRTIINFFDSLKNQQDSSLKKLNELGQGSCLKAGRHSMGKQGSRAHPGVWRPRGRVPQQARVHFPLLGEAGVPAQLALGEGAALAG
jgi:hypothetical protein